MLRRVVLAAVALGMATAAWAQDPSLLGGGNNAGGQNQSGTFSGGVVQQQQGSLQTQNPGIPAITNMNSGVSPGGAGVQLMLDPDPIFAPLFGPNQQQGYGQSNRPYQQNQRNQQSEQFQRRFPPERHEFQDMVAQSLGHDLPMFGSELFTGVPSTFSPTNIAPVTPDYVVGPGDEIIINGWGQVDINYRAIVDRNGAITIPRVGTINVAGLSVQSLEGHLRAAIGRVFTNFDLRVTMGRLRAMQIYVTGLARRPGTYTVSSLSTLVNVLFVSGGPSFKGSLRAVQVKRGGSVVVEFDLYDFLIKGDKSKDVRLLPGDVVNIQPVGALAAISGSVNNPAIFEMRPGDKLGDLVELAGGFTVTAAGQKAMVERIANRQTRQVEDFTLDKQGMEKPLRDGDLVRVLPLSPRFDNAVTVRGNVDTIARHPWRKGMRIKDVIPDREALIVRDYWSKRNQVVRLDVIDREQEEARMREIQEARRRSSNLGYQDDRPDPSADDERDRFGRLPGSASQQGRFAAVPLSDAQLANTERRERERREALLREGSTASLGQERLRTEIRRVLPEVNWDYAVVERLNWRDLTTQLIPFNLSKAVLEGDPTQNIMLQPGDVITVFSKDDIKVPLAKRSVFVKLEGEIAVAGVYQGRPGETLRQLVARVGGLASNAYLYGAEFERESTRAIQQKRLDESVDRLEQDVQRNNTNRAGLSREEAEAMKSVSDAQSGLIARLRKARATGRIVLEMPMGASQVKDLPDLVLEDGDRFYVPPIPSTVAVVGAVYNANAFIYRPEKRLNDYLAQSGGPTKDGETSSVYLIRADGSVVSKRQSGFVFSRFEREQMMPGDTLVVPENLDRYRWTRDLRDWSQILYQFALGVAGLKVLKE